MKKNVSRVFFGFISIYKTFFRVNLILIYYTLILSVFQLIYKDKLEFV